MPRSSPDPRRVVDRLRELEVRLASLGAARNATIDAFREALLNLERDRVTLYGQAMRALSSFGRDTAEAIVVTVAPKLGRVADRATAELADSAAADDAGFSTDLLEQRLGEQERRFRTMLAQFASVRKRSEHTHKRLELAGDRMDKLWQQQDHSGIGGWREVLRTISAQLEAERPTR